jgi:hypothetical protein
MASRHIQEERSEDNKKDSGVKNFIPLFFFIEEDATFQFVELLVFGVDG